MDDYCALRLNTKAFPCTVYGMYGNGSVVVAGCDGRNTVLTCRCLGSCVPFGRRAVGWCAVDDGWHCRRWLGEKRQVPSIYGKKHSKPLILINVEFSL